MRRHTRGDGGRSPGGDFEALRARCGLSEAWPPGKGSTLYTRARRSSKLTFDADALALPPEALDEGMPGLLASCTDGAAAAGERGSLAGSSAAGGAAATEVGPGASADGSAAAGRASVSSIWG